MSRFPSTKDERFLLGIAEESLRLSDTFFEWVDWRKIAKDLNFGEKSCQNIVNILARTALVRKKAETVALTEITMRHYGDELCRVCEKGKEFQKLPDTEYDTEECDSEDNEDEDEL